MSGEVLTFYSYKGGTGRSMLLANVAWQLASIGKRVLVIDWDLEAPGVHRYFKPFLGRDPELREQIGVIDWLQDFWDAYLDQPDTVSVEKIVREYADPRLYVKRLDTDGLINDGGIDLLGPGRQDSSYASSVADFDFVELYEKLRGAEFIDVSKKILTGTGGYDYVLIDSRTGVSDTSGFCTVSLADTLIVCFTYNNQSIIGASNIARNIKKQVELLRKPNHLDNSNSRRFRLFAVPSRVDDLNFSRLERRQQYAWHQFSDLLTDIAPDQQPEYWLKVQLHYKSQFAYEEILAACVNRSEDPQSLLGAVTALTCYLTGGAFKKPLQLSDEKRAQLYLEFEKTLESNNETRITQNAWQQFTLLHPDTTHRDTILENCFPLIIQLFTNSLNDENTDKNLFIPTTLLEQQLTPEERSMADTLTSCGIVQRRITEDMQVGLKISDESVVENWEYLSKRLSDQFSFITAREQLRQLRLSWETGACSTRQIITGISTNIITEFSNERSNWLGQLNSKFLRVFREFIERDEQEINTQIIKKELQQKITQLENENKSLNKILAGLTRTRTLFISTSLSLIVFLGLCLLTLYYAKESYKEFQAKYESSQKELYKANELNKDSQDKLKDLQEKLDEKNASSSFVQAMDFIEKGKKNSRQHNGKLLAIENFNKAIESLNLTIKTDSTYANAYKQRAEVRRFLNSKNRDWASEFEDWCTYYNLRPSLSGRKDLIISMMDKYELDSKNISQFITEQLPKLLEDAQKTESKDASPTRIAEILTSNLKKYTTLPFELKLNVQNTIHSLQSI